MKLHVSGGALIELLYYYEFRNSTLMRLLITWPPGILTTAHSLCDPTAKPGEGNEIPTYFLICGAGIKRKIRITVAIFIKL
ncbi:hypothetical protein DC498_01480 [Terrimonas sp.]|nr:hypothetical protein DC498_01480 [Terrimonas sp.]